jgi:lipopolysaccharide export system permease protein
LIYQRYIFRNIALNFSAIISILIALIWFSRAIPFIKYVTENGVELSQFLYLFVLILPWLLLFIIPVSLLGSALTTYNRLIVGNEITILKNSGLTKFSIAKPAILLAIIASFFCFMIAFFAMPYANKELRISRNNIDDNYTSLSFNPQTFETLKELTIYAKNRDENNQLFGILIHDERQSQYSITITAKNGKIVIEDKSALLYMQEGTVQKFNYQNNKSEILNFDEYVFNLTEDKKINKSLHWKAKERYLSELFYPEDGIEKIDIGKFRVEIYQRFTYPLLPIVFVIISLGFILRGDFKRRGNSKNIILTILVSSLFLATTTAIYELIVSNPNFIILLFLNFFVFIGFGINLLIQNRGAK